MKIKLSMDGKRKTNIDSNKKPKVPGLLSNQTLEAVSQDNVRLREKLQEFGDSKAKKQELELQEFSLDIKQLEETETGKKSKMFNVYLLKIFSENLKKDREQCRESKTKAEALVKLGKQCYYNDMNTVVADYKKNSLNFYDQPTGNIEIKDLH
ncbi:hypothetical protein CAEBREN_14532 [Caenorhabditis brenneri]|uniref:Uncharacterized protein n=1 Tax=Caenorhabditis brenneri TaxID=135651 RepID=G0P300_CAEBE|nr:hypothetical protein CAEBREN_14532 [Caenorhabditis brenneri]